jgi:two-component system, NtrC family, response regulator PilR
MASGMAMEPAEPGVSPRAAPGRPRALVVDDEAHLRELLEITLIGMGLDVDCAPDLARAREFLDRGHYALCLTDMRLPDGDGLQLVEAIAARDVHLPVAVITAYGSAGNAVAALKAGAFDYLSKPVALDALRALVRSALALPAAGHAAARGGQSARGETTLRLVGDSAPMQAVRTQIERLARSMAPVAITGESGSGKELAARLIHECGPRAGRPFVAVNCGAIPETLMESEFFGYRKGAFSGADQDRTGFFQAASGGTLFLDEVADLPLAMQVKLLRAIQEKRVRRLGATSEEPVDVRIISATHQDLARCVEAGRFRQDLFYRLNVIELALPALRERVGDIAPLAESILARLARRAGIATSPRLSSVTLRYLQSYPFPGNVRELENLLERALAFSNGEVINVEDLGLRPVINDSVEDERDGGSVDGAAQQDHPAAPGALTGRPVQLSPDGVPDCLPDYLDQVEREAILRALERTGHNRTAAARLLGITFRALRYRMQRLGLA